MRVTMVLSSMYIQTKDPPKSLILMIRLVRPSPVKIYLGTMELLIVIERLIALRVTKAKVIN